MLAVDDGDVIDVADVSSKDSKCSGLAATPGGRPPPLTLGLLDDATLDDSVLEDDHAIDNLPPAPRRSSAAASFARRGFAAAEAPPMSLVAPRLYVGDANAAASLPSLRAAGVTHVLNCTHLPNVCEGAEGAPIYLKLGLRDSVSDTPMLESAFASGVDFISSALAHGGTVLVHCRAGISRSPTLAAAYLVRATQTPIDTIFCRMREKRSIIDPNLTYWVALKEWERKVLKHSSSSPRTTARVSPKRVRPLSRVG